MNAKSNIARLFQYSSQKPLIHFLTLILILLFTVLYGRAQDWKHVTFDVGGGVSPLAGDIHRRLHNGWNVRVGGGYNFTSRFSTSLQDTSNVFGGRRNVLHEG